MGVLLGNLILFRTGYNIFCPEKMFNTFFTSMRKPNFSLTEKKPFLISLYLQTRSFTPLSKSIFFSQAPVFYLVSADSYVTKGGFYAIYDFSDACNPFFRLSFKMAALWHDMA